MKDLKQTLTKKTWTTPTVQAIELSTAKGGATGGSDHLPQGHS
jgi:hypothetical protein